MSFPPVSHLGDVHAVVNVDHLKPKVVDPRLLLLVVVLAVEAVVVSLVGVRLEASGAVWRGDPDASRKVGEVHAVLPRLGAGDDGQETEPPLDLLRDVGGPDLTARAGGLGRAVQKHHQLKVLVGKGVRRQLVEGTRPVDHVVEGHRANKEQVVLSGVDHEVDVHLVQNDGVSVRRGGRPQQLAVDLAADQQGLPKVRHSDQETQTSFLQADDGRVAEGHRLRPIFGQGDLGQDDAAHEAVDEDADQRLDDEESHGAGAVARRRPAAVPDGGLGLQGVEERRGEAVHVVHAPDVSGGAVLPRQIPVALGDPVPQQAEEEPAARERRHEQEEDEAPADLHERGPEVHEVRHVVAVFNVAELDVATAVFADQAGFAASVSSRLDVTLEHLEHPGAAGNRRSGPMSTDGFRADKVPQITRVAKKVQIRKETN